MLPDSAGGPGAPLRQVSPSTSPVSTRADQSVAETAEPLTVEMESCSESEASLVAGDMEVVASAAPGPISPCRTRSMGKARSPKPLEDRDGQAVGGQSSAPSPGPIPPPAIALSSEGPDARILRSHREVWEDQLQWEEVRFMKLKSGVVEASQEPPSTPMLCESSPSSVQSEPRDAPGSQVDAPGMFPRSPSPL